MEQSESIYAATIEAIWSSVAAESEFKLNDDMDNELSLDFKLDSDISYNGLTTNDAVNGEILPPSFEENSPYIVYKGYTAKRKDEISLPLGTEAYVLEEKDQRKYVAAINNIGQEFDRGWVPSFCLLLKEEAIETSSIDAKPPTFLKPLEHGTAVEGESTELMVHVNGFPKPEVTWYLDGLPVRNDLQHRVIEDDDVNVLHISAVGVDDEGVYTVKANNTLGSSQCQAELLVESDESSVSGSSDLEWEDPTVPIKNIKNANKKNLSNGKSQNIMNGSVTINGNATLKHPKNAKRKGPSFTKHLTDSVVDEGDSVSFYVEISGDQNSKVTWYMKNKEVKTDNRIFICGVGLVHTMTITEVEEVDNGNIKCTVSNAHGSIESKCTLRVQKKMIDSNNNNSNNPYVFCSEETISIVEDADAEFNIEYGGDPPPTVSWHKEHIHLTSDYGVIIDTGPKKSKLVIPEVTKDDCGSYSCIAENVHGEAKACITLCVTNKSQPTSPEIEIDESLETEGPPDLIDRLRDKTISEGDPLLLQINAIGNPKPSIKWLQDNKCIEEDVNCKFEQWNHVYRLFIPLCELSNSGEYSCVLENIHGSKSCSANITVQESIFPPKFFQHTNDILVQVGQPSQLDAIIKAKPSPTVEWYKDNRQLMEKNGFKFIANDNQYSLYIPEVTSKHSGTYKCIAFNNAGESACIIRVKVGDTLPKFSEPLQDIKVFGGQTMKLSVRVNSQTPVTTNWYKNGDPISDLDNFSVEQVNNGSFRLIKENITQDDSGTYRCEASNASGKNSCQCSVTVGASGGLPSFTKGLTDTRALEYEKGVCFEVIVSGDPLPDVLFYKDGAVIEASPRRALSQEGNKYILQLKYALFDDAGEYAAVASNCNGDQETRALFEVLPHNTCPEFFRYENHIEVNEGEELVLSASVKGNPRPKIQWMKEKVLINNDKEHVLKEHGGTCSLVIPSASSSDSGEWKCVATNTAGNVDVSITVRVNESTKMFSPEFLSMLTDIDVLLGETAHFQVALIGYPEPTVSWKKDSSVIKEDKNTSFTKNSGVYTMTIKGCMETDAGVYECLAKNIIGDVTCQSLLNVIDISTDKVEANDTEMLASEKNNSPKFLQSLHNVTVEEGEQITLETTVSGDPMPNVKWFKQDKQLNDGKRISISSADGGKTTLVIASAELSDCGDYECLAGNVNGEASIYCEVFVKEMPKDRKVENPEKPVISGAPEEPQQVMEGEEIKFSCNVIANPPPKFEILKNDKPYKPPHGSIRFENNLLTFHIAESKTKDDAVYEIIAVNDEGKDSFKVEVLVEPTAELEVVTKIIEARSSADGQTQSTSSTTSDEDDTSSKKSSYSTRPYSKSKSKKSRKSINGENKDDDAEGDELDSVFNVEPDDSHSPVSDPAISDEKPTREQLDSEEILEEIMIPETNSSLHSEPLHQLDDMGDEITTEEKNVRTNVRIVEENVVGSVVVGMSESAPEALDILTGDNAPCFTVLLNDISTIAGQSVTLTCSYENAVPGDVSWTKNGDELLNEDGFVTIETTHITSSVKFLSTRIVDNGEYECEIKNSKGTATCTADVIILPEIKLDWVQALSDMTVTEGDKVSLCVEVEGLPIPSVHFLVKGKTIQNSDRIAVIPDEEKGKYELIINKASLKDSQSYKCIAQNEQSQIECSAKLLVQEIMLAPEFINELHDCEVAESDPLSLKVDCSGKPTPMVEWYLNGKVLKPSSRIKFGVEGKSNVLRINESQLGDAGTYKAVCFNSAGDIESLCNVTVLEDVKAPRFLSQPANAKITEGGEASFEVRFTGKPEPVPSWSCNGEIIMPNDNFNIETDLGKSTLSISKAERTHSGKYCCEITSKNSSDKCHMKLTVNQIQSKPSFCQDLRDVAIKEGETVTFSIEIMGTPKPEVSWLKDGKPLTQNDRVLFTQENTLSMLIMFQCDLADSGTYEIVAKNNAGKCSSRAQLEVEEIESPPSFKTSLNNMEFTEGEDVEISVEVSGIPKPEIKWLRNDSVITDDKKMSVLNKDDCSTLKIRNCQITHSGKYRCLAQNQHGIEETSCVIEINEALSAPLFEQKPVPEMELLENDEFSLEFMVKGKPEPSVSVTKNGKKIDPKIALFECVEGHGFLKIPHVAKVDEGIYKIRAENSEGTTSCSVALVVPDTLKFIAALSDTTVIEGNDAELSVEFRGNVLDADWYKDNEYIDESDKYAIIDEQTKCICIIRNCKPSDSGVYRCEILNEKASVFCTANLSVTSSKTKPSFDKTLRDFVAGEGDATTLSVIASGSPIPECKWFKDNIPLTSSAEMVIASDENTHMLMFSTISSKDAGKYRCELKNAVGSAVCEGTMTVTASSRKPTFITTLDSKMEVTEGNEFIVSVCVDGTPSPQVTFLKDGEKIKYDKRIFTKTGKNGETSLFIKKASFDDEGEYSALASNSAGSESSVGILLVQKESISPKFISKPRDIIVYENCEGIFDMKVSGIPEPCVNVYHNEKLVTTAYVKDEVCDIILENCGISHAGKYTFEAVNDAGKATVQACMDIQVAIKSASFEQMLEEKYVGHVGGELSLKCIIAGNPPPEVKFYKDDRDITGDSRYDISANDQEILLKFSDCTIADSGIYTCQIGNSTGVDSCSAHVRVSPPNTAPKIISHLGDILIDENEKLKVDVQLDGYPIPEIQLFHGDEEVGKKYIIQDDNVVTYSKSPIELNDDGTYTIVATNSYGEDRQYFSVKVSPSKKAPEIKKKLVDINAFEGDKLSLEIHIESNPTSEVTWYKDDVILTETHGFSFKSKLNDSKFYLLHDKMGLDHCGIYKVFVSNAIGEATCSCQVGISEKPEAPKFVKKMENLKADEGSDVCFHVTVTGKPVPEVTWFKDRFEVKNKGRSEIDSAALNAYLDLPSASVKDSGKYKCVVKNTSGEISSYAMLKVSEVIYPPIFVNELEDICLVEGQQLSINHECTGTQPMKVKWLKNGKSLYKSATTRLEKTSTGYSLKIAKSSAYDSGTYALELQNSAGTNSKSCNVTVDEAPVAPLFSMKPRDVTIDEGKDIDVNVKVSGKPLPTLKWFINDVEILGRDNVTTTDKKDGAMCLSIKSASLEYSGTLRCEAVNSTGQVSTSCKITVNEIARRPEFEQLLKDIEVDEGKAMKLSVIVSATPEPNVTWYKNQKIIKESSRVKLKVDEDKNFYVCTLTIAKTDIDDAGNYKISMRNKAGERSSTCIVSVNEIPTKPVFIKGLKEINAQSGDVIRMPVEVKTNRKPIISWEKDGAEVRGVNRNKIEEKNGSSTLIINDANVKDSGLYACIAKNAAGSSTSECEVFVSDSNPPPKFETKLQDFTVNEGEDIELAVIVSGHPKPQVSFHKENKRIQNIDGITITDDDGEWSVLIEDAGPSDSGVYECKVFNENGEAFCSCHVTVNESMDSLHVQCVEGNDFVTAAEGSDVTFEAEIFGSPDMVDWTFGDIFLDSDEKYQIEVGEEHSTLRIFHINEEDAGNYACIVASDSNEVEQMFTLKVVKAPKKVFDKTTSRKEMFETKKTSSFDKKLPGETFVKKSVEQKVTTSVMEQSSVKTSSRASSFERNVSPDEERKSSGGKKSPTGAGGLKNKFLKAKGTPPVFSMEPKSKDVRKGSIAKFTCNCTAIPDASITWYYENQPIISSDRYQIKDTYGFANFVIKSATFDDIGNYKVIADNTLGTCEAAFSLSVNGLTTRGTSGSNTKNTVSKNENISGRIISSNKMKTPEMVDDFVMDAEPDTIKTKSKTIIEHSKTTTSQMNTVKKSVDIPPKKNNKDLKGVEQMSKRPLAADEKITTKTSAPLPGKKPVSPPEKKHEEPEDVTFIRELPDELVIKKGSTLHLEVELSNNEGEVFWERDGEQLEDCKNIRLGNKGHVHFLEIDDMQSDDEGDFEVFIEFGDNEISCMCEVYIDDTTESLTPAPSIRDEGQPTKNVEKIKIATPMARSSSGDNGLFAVEEKLKPTVVECGEGTSFLVVLTRPADSYEWLINNKVISNSNKYNMEVDVDHYVLTINNCDMFLDKKVIQFIGYSGDKDVTSQTKLTVIPATPLLIEKCDLSQEGTTGDNIPLSVEVKGFNNPHIQWMKGFKLLTNNANRHELSFQNRIATLALKNVGTYDSGIYKCMVSEGGKKFEKKFNVKIKAKKLAT